MSEFAGVIGLWMGLSIILFGAGFMMIHGLQDSIHDIEQELYKRAVEKAKEDLLEELEKEIKNAQVS